MMPFEGRIKKRTRNYEVFLIDGYTGNAFNVLISGFTINGGGDGIQINGADGCNINMNIISAINYGIEIRGDYTIITNNKIFNCETGIDLPTSWNNINNNNIL